MSGWEIVQTPLKPHPTGTQVNDIATCPAGKRVLGGGALGGGALPQNINSSWPKSPTEWQTYVNNTGPATTFAVYAICAAVSP